MRSLRDIYGADWIGNDKRRQPTHGKRKARRHGQKLKANRRHISKRIRRKHRRAA